MIITDYNSMTLDELEAINRVLHREFIVEDGKIKEVEAREEK